MPYLSTPRRPVRLLRGRRRAPRGRSPEAAGRPDRYQSLRPRTTPSGTTSRARRWRTPAGWTTDGSIPARGHLPALRELAASLGVLDKALAVDFCPFATPACREACLNWAGRGGLGDAVALRAWPPVAVDASGPCRGCAGHPVQHRLASPPRSCRRAPLGCPIGRHG